MRIKINLQIFIFIIIFIFTKQIEIYTYLMIFAFVHELGHLFTGLILGLEPETLKIMPFGISIIFKTYRGKTKIYIKKLLIAIAGPVVNIIIALFGIIFMWNSKIVYANLLIAIFNLLPIYPLDGGRIIKAILLINYPSLICQGLVLKISYITITLLTFFTSITILYLKNIGLLIVLVYLWSMVLKEKKKYKFRERVYNIVKNKQEYIDN